MANHPTTYYVGLDLGQSQDYTALAVIQKVPTYDKQTGKHSSELHLKHLERYPLKTPYTDIADQVKSLPSPRPHSLTAALPSLSPNSSWIRPASGWPSRIS